MPEARTDRCISLLVKRCCLFCACRADGWGRDRCARAGAADRIVKRLARRAGIGKQISPHSLRHTSSPWPSTRGVALRDVQERTSHAESRTTMRYDRGRQSLDRHATYIVAAFVAGPPRTSRTAPAVPGDTVRRIARHRRKSSSRVTPDGPDYPRAPQIRGSFGYPCRVPAGHQSCRRPEATGRGVDEARSVGALVLGRPRRRLERGHRWLTTALWFASSLH